MSINALAVICRENHAGVIARRQFFTDMECRLNDARRMAVQWMVGWFSRRDHDRRPDVIELGSQRPFAASKDSLVVHCRFGSQVPANLQSNFEAECNHALSMRAKNGSLVKGDAAGQTDPAPQSLTNIIITTYLLANGDDLADAPALASPWIFYARIGARDDRLLG